MGADFAPSSLPPSLRIRFFAQHLPEFGWEPIVLTTDARYYEHPVDWENIRLLPEGLRVIRTTALPARLSRLFGIGDVGIRSLWQHWRAIKQLCRDGSVDLLFIPVPPYVPMILGRMTYDRFQIPYVVDYIDPWVTDYYWSVPKAQRPPKWILADALSRWLEPYALKHVAHLVGVSRGTTDTITDRYRWLSAADCTEIPYGAEEDDFNYLRSHPRPNPIFSRHDGYFHLSSVGRGGVDQREILRTLFAAVRLGLDRARDLFSRLRIHFVGTSYSANGQSAQPVLALSRDFQLEGVVSEHTARVPYLDALQILRDSNGLLAVGSEERHYTASKIFPYLLARKPTLALFHEASSVVEIMRETKVGPVITFGSEHSSEDRIEAIATSLEYLLRLPPDYEPQRCHETFKKYTTRASAGRLAGVFEQALGKQPDASTVPYAGLAGR